MLDHLEFPRLVYKSEAIYVLAKTENDYMERIAEGWFSTVPEALAGKAEQPGQAEEEPVMIVSEVKNEAEIIDVTEDSSPPTREELEDKAAELGIKFDGRTNNHLLGRKIKEVLKAAK